MKKVKGITEQIVIKKEAKYRLIASFLRIQDPEDGRVAYPRKVMRQRWIEILVNLKSLLPFLLYGNHIPHTLLVEVHTTISTINNINTTGV